VTGSASGSDVLNSTVGSAVGTWVGCLLRSDGVGRIDVKPDLVG